MKTQNNEGRVYYYRPLAGNSRVFKCAGFGAEQEDHRAFYVPYFTRTASPESGIAAGEPILSPYVGDKIIRSA